MFGIADRSGPWPDILTADHWKSPDKYSIMPATCQAVYENCSHNVQSAALMPGKKLPTG